MKGRLSVLLLACVIAIFAACGGGGGSNPGGGTPPSVTPPGPVVTITTNALPATVSGVAYNATLTASGGTAPYKWQALNLTLPQGFDLSPDGVLTGKYPSYFGGIVANVQIQVTDSASPPNVATRTLVLDVFGFVPDQFRLPLVGFGITDSIQATGGAEPVQWQLTGTLPPGLSFIKNPASLNTRQYQFSGTITQAGTYAFSITATDSSSPPRTQTKQFSMQVEPAQLTMPTAQPAVAVAGQAYSHSFAPSGGAAPFNLTWYPNDSNGMPSGLALDPQTGILSGTPTAPGYYNFTVMVTDSSVPQQQRTTGVFWLLVSPKPLAAHNDSVANALHIFPGRYTASISPLQVVGGTLLPAHDYFEATAPAGSNVFVSAANEYWTASRGWTTTVLDPVLELVDANGRRLVACNDPLDDNPPSAYPLAIDTTPNGFDDPCMNWPGDGNTFGNAKRALLTLKVPGTSGNTTFYIHIFDWRGDSRPDMLYTLTFSQQ